MWSLQKEASMLAYVEGLLEPMLRISKLLLNIGWFAMSHRQTPDSCLSPSNGPPTRVSPLRSDSVRMPCVALESKGSLTRKTSMLGLPNKTYPPIHKRGLLQGILGYFPSKGTPTPPEFVDLKLFRLGPF